VGDIILQWTGAASYTQFITSGVTYAFTHAQLNMMNLTDTVSPLPTANTPIVSVFSQDLLPMTETTCNGVYFNCLGSMPGGMQYSPTLPGDIKQIASTPVKLKGSITVQLVDGNLTAITVNATTKIAVKISLYTLD